MDIRVYGNEAASSAGSFLLMARQAHTKIQTRGLHKTFYEHGSRVPCLAGIDFHANNNELVSIIGPSGCGKSTLLNIIAGLDQPDAGTVELDGAPQHHRLGSVGYMQQKDLLMPWRNVLDNAILGLEVQGVPRQEARRRARELLGPFGLEGFENYYPHALSGGMRQRAAFLRTVLVGHDVVLLDEPFGALDALTRSQMQSWLLGLLEDLNKTIILVTHDVDEALLLSDRVYVLTASPGAVSMVADVGLPKPRSTGMVGDGTFISLKLELLSALRNENHRRGESAPC